MKTNKIIVKLIILNILGLFLIPQYALLANPGAKLRLAYDDGLQCYLNGIEVFNALGEAHGGIYWNKEISVDNYLQNGQNILACRVSNGDGNRGSGYGYFDTELVVNSQTVIPKGSSDWKYFGETNKTNPPYTDSSGKNWYQNNYNDGLWKTGSTPFDGRKGDVLKQAPDDAWFRKFFDLNTSFSSFYPPANVNCSSFTNETICLSRGCFWNGSVCSNQLTNQTTFLSTNFTLFGCWRPTIHRFGQYSHLSKNLGEIFLDTARPLITGLVKYGNQIEIYVDNQSIGKAIVKEGEDSGIANFYFQPKGSIIPSSLNNLTSHDLKIVSVNPLDQSICTNETITFKVKPYPAPIIHRLGEILYVTRANKLTIKTRNPLVTGIVRSDSVVEIFVDDQYIGRAKIQKGKNMDNFYLNLPTLALGQHTLYARAKKASQESIVSAPSQVFEFTVIE